MNDPSPQDDTTLRNLRRLIWLYFWLLLFEGALRKWVLPQLSNPLLLIRDPVVIAIYMLSLRARVFPRNAWVLSLGIIGVLSLLLSVLVMVLNFGLPPKSIAIITGFGFRSNFLHLPLIFVMAKVVRMEDVKRFGWWTLVMSVPMSLLLVAQFQAGPESWLNRTAGGEGEMLGSALGKVRTAGTFSYVLGVVAFYSLATSFLVWAALRGEIYKTWVLIGAGAAIVIGIAMSGSRSVVGAVAVVVASLVVVFFVRPSAINRFGQTLIIALILGLIVTRLPIFKEGFNVLTTRFSEVAEATEKSVGAGLVERVFSGFTESAYIWSKAPFLGYGLGIGTNAGAKFLTGRNMFLLSEGEWSRIFLESGPLFGLAYVFWRVALVVRVGLFCVASVKLGNVLPLLIFSSSFMPLLNGQLGQPTVLGFVAFATGLALAARNGDNATPGVTPEGGAGSKAAPVRRIPRRSEFASRLHRPPPAPARQDHANGAVDR
jgi:hypothetical protein